MSENVEPAWLILERSSSSSSDSSSSSSNSEPSTPATTGGHGLGGKTVPSGGRSLPGPGLHTNNDIESDDVLGTQLVRRPDTPGTKNRKRGNISDRASPNKRVKKEEVPLPYAPPYLEEALFYKPFESTIESHVPILDPEESFRGYHLYPTLRKFVEDLPVSAHPPLTTITDLRNLVSAYHVPPNQHLPVEIARTLRAHSGITKQYVKQQFNLKCGMHLHIDEYNQLVYILLKVINMIIFGHWNAFRAPKQMGSMSVQWNEVIEKTSVPASGEGGAPLYNKNGARVHASPLQDHKNVMKVYDFCSDLSAGRLGSDEKTLGDDLNSRE